MGYTGYVYASQRGVGQCSQGRPVGNSQAELGKTSDPWVLQTVQGYSLELVTAPTQLSPPGQVHLPGRQETLTGEEIKNLLEKGAIERVRVPHHPQYISQMLLVLKNLS